MPFIKLNNSWSNLAQQYNKAFNNKPEVPTIKYTGFDDGLIRGGAINVGIATVRDTARIGKFFASTKGVLFITKQVGLQLSNPPLEQFPPRSPLPTKNQNTIDTISNTVVNFVNSKSPTQTYNLGINTLAQIPINAIGGHIIRHGLLPFGGVGFFNGDSANDSVGKSVRLYNYEYVTRENNKNGNNRLVGYLGKLYQNNGTSAIELTSYNGGAASVYGIGKTFIKTTSLSTDRLPLNSTGLFLQYNGINNYFNTYRKNTKDGRLEVIGGIPVTDLGENYNRPIIGPNDPQPITSPTTNIKDLDFEVFGNQRTYPVQNIQSRIGTSTSYFGPNNIKTNYKVDSINVINVTNSKTFYDNSRSAKKLASDVLTDYEDKVTGYYGRDIVKFRFEFLNNDTPIAIDENKVPYTNTDVLAFRAYIDDFQDGMNAKWNSYRYMGRGEEFYVYEGFSRDISVAFTIFAHSPEEMKPIYTKLNYLMSTFAPDYSSANKMRGNIGYLTVGDYLYRQPGVFTDIKLSGLLDSHWEIALGQPEGDINDIAQYEVPKHIKVNISFKPIHTFLPRKVQKDKYSNTSFITPDKKAYPEQAGVVRGSDGTIKFTNKYLD